ncbi:HAD-IIA family hydrolase [Candidatus Bipolaricaulota bacterium]
MAVARVTRMIQQNSGIEGYLLDLDGTVYLGESLIEGAGRAIETLRTRGRKIAFLTNKPLHSRGDYAEKLTSLGVPASEEDVVTSSYVLARYLAENAPGARVFAIGEEPLLVELRDAGLVLTDAPEEIEYVVAAFDRTFDYRKLNIGFQALRRGARFIATNPDRTCPVEGGEIPDAAAVIASLEATSQRKVETVVGKPSRYMTQAGLERLGVPAERAAIVGDRLETDVAMGLNGGLVAILTLSGVTTREIFDASTIKPDYVIENLTELSALDERFEAGIPTDDQHH